MKLLCNDLTCHSCWILKVAVKEASSSIPGLPPSSLMVFLSEFPNIEGVVLTEYDTHFLNRFFESHLDVDSNINASSIAAVSVLVAHTLHRLAFCPQQGPGGGECRNPPSIEVRFPRGKLDSKLRNGVKGTKESKPVRHQEHGCFGRAVGDWKGCEKS